MDSAANFIWVSTRNYPSVFQNLQRGTYSAGNVSNTGLVHGDFYILTLNWLIMDQMLSYDGNYLYYCNAYFNSCSNGPCDARLGVAQRMNDSTFNKLPNTDGIMQNIDDTNYLVYAPQVSKNGLELYYTRLLKSTFNTEICVAVRKNITDTFSLPMVIYSNNGLVPEAPTVTANDSILYYHRLNKNPNGNYHIYMRYRTGTTGINEVKKENEFSLYPNPSSGKFTVFINHPEVLYSPNNYSNGVHDYNSESHLTIEIYNMMGEKIYSAPFNIQNSTFNINQASGVYFLRIISGGEQVFSQKIVVEK